MSGAADANDAKPRRWSDLWTGVETWGKRLDTLVKTVGAVITIVAFGMAILQPGAIKQWFAVKGPLWYYVGDLTGPPTYRGFLPAGLVSYSAWASAPINFDRFFRLPGKNMIALAPGDGQQPVTGRDQPSLDADIVTSYPNRQCLRAEAMNFTPYLRFQDRTTESFGEIRPGANTGQSGDVLLRSLIDKLDVRFKNMTAKCSDHDCVSHIAVWVKARTAICDSQTGPSR